MEGSGRPNQIANTQSSSVFVARQNDMEILGKSFATVQTSIHQEGSAKKMKPTGKITSPNVFALLEYQNYRCALTGRSLTPQEASLDHIVPVRDGGEHLIENTQVLHRDVNRAKSVFPNETFIQMCKEVASYSA